jgi:urease accessory protein
VPLDQSDGLGILARLEPVVEAVTQAALAADLDDLVSAVPMVDCCSMRHETDYTRLFRS